MAYTIRISLAGFNTLTETDLENYALYADTNNVLIKEKARGSVEVADSDSETIAHSLSYIPFIIVFFEISSGVWRKLGGDDEFNGEDTYVKVDTTNLEIFNYTGAAVDYKYYIFYDQMV